MTSSASDQLTKGSISLKGSATIVSEFFNYGVQSILYQRGVYPPESFSRKQEYGLTLLVSTDDRVKKYMEDILSQIKIWLEKDKIRKLVVVLSNVETKEVLERWEFKIEVEKETDDDGVERRVETSAKDIKLIKQEIRDVIRQITASVTFLPLLDCICSFNILLYTKMDIECPSTWDESDPCFITNSEEVKLRSFSTAIHRVEAAVSYKIDN
uniref:Mitotic spindle assembly checkpoint protein MAD2A n=1 Tax=Caligus rogercresseyi TaxID=217165 RepID=C1BNE6_CALRO|nr:Mitotic spindle assembly checkpoint protein MAD2A [Caligus rogercresseyi]|eukprot:TRINITY_DN11101_c0_g1_i1.p1 TRINITY_DN11101_c0_g1~~TRINITY_DN11101_c0_g1_i1.p1  ORF type:complete len:212 (+),score=61.14 TRINITY_DN11101_c0_g1_i1:83-718(+)